MSPINTVETHVHIGDGWPGHPTHTHPLLLVLHQYLLQSHLLARQAMLCLKHLPGGQEGNAKELIRLFSYGSPLPHQRKPPARDSRVGLSLLSRALGYPTIIPYLQSLSEPLLPPSSPRHLSERSCSPHKLLSANPPGPPPQASGSSQPVSSDRPGRAAARPSKTRGQI